MPTALLSSHAYSTCDRKLQVEPLPPSDPEAGKAEEEDGVRMPPGTVDQLHRRAADVSWSSEGHTHRTPFVYAASHSVDPVPNCRLLSNTTQGILDGMRAAAAAQEPWRLVNGAALAWNSYLHLPQHQRYADALPLLLPVLQLLLRPPTAAAPAAGAAPAAASTGAGAVAGAPAHGATGGQQAPAGAAGTTAVAGGARAAGRRWEVAAKVAEAVAKGAEHKALLQLLKPSSPQSVNQSRAPSAIPAASPAQAGGGGAPSCSAVPQQLAFRQGANPWYVDLQVARQRAGAHTRLGQAACGVQGGAAAPCIRCAERRRAAPWSSVLHALYAASVLCAARTLCCQLPVIFQQRSKGF